MPARPLRPVDVVALASFQRRASGTEITAHTWPRVDPDSGNPPFLSLVGTALAQRLGSQRVWLSRSGRQLAGLAVARPRAGSLVWDVVHLHAAPEADEVACELLERVAAHAGAHAARRVLLEAPAGGRGQHVARRAGFSRFALSTLYQLAPGFRAERTDLFEARPRLRADEQALFSLYGAAVPAQVRAAEAMTLEEWGGLFPGPGGWRPSLSGTRQQFVWELGAGLVGWMEVIFGRRSQCIELLVHARYEDAADRLLRYALLQVSPKAPVYAAAREYQPALASALERAGFRAVGRHELFVKLLTARVPEPRLVPANVVGG